MQCAGCGEPWSCRTANHQPTCDARPLLSRGTVEGRALAEATYRVNFDAMERASG